MRMGVPPPQPPVSPPSATPLPGCFLMLGFFAVFVAACAIIALGDPSAGGTSAEKVAARVATGVVAVASLLAAEALWWRRRWVLLATTAMFVSLLAAPVVVHGGDGWRDMTSDFELLVVVIACVACTLAYVRHKSVQFFGKTRVAAAPPPPRRGMP